MMTASPQNQIAPASTAAPALHVCLPDHELASELKRHQGEGRTRWHVIANAYSVRVLSAGAQNQLVEVGIGDLGSETQDQLKIAAKAKKLSWASVDSPNLQEVTPDLSNPTIQSASQLNAWLKRRDHVTTGRQGEISDPVKAEVASLAAWRCQFEGCGENLRTHVIPGVRGNFSYFAHIVASSAEGPRGDTVLSPKLANDPTNILLLCDKCHRTIDRVAPHLYTRQRLQEMRSRNITSVERCLDSLRYPVAHILVLAGNVQGQSAAFDESVAQEALWLRKLRSDNARPDWFARNAGHLGDAHSVAFWSSLFALLKDDILRLRAILNGTGQDSVLGLPLAVFPAPHTTSVLTLFGRLLGESRSIHLFQFHRDQVGGAPGGQWAWLGEPPAKDKYTVKVLRPPQTAGKEATLLVYLTDSIPSEELPSTFYENKQWTRPTIEISVGNPNRRVIAHPDDLELFGLAVDDALQKLQDQWRVSKIHLVVIAPITACVRIGQKMQARCQPDFILYERDTSAAATGRGRFVSTIAITPTTIVHLKTEETCPLC